MVSQNTLDTLHGYIDLLLEHDCGFWTFGCASVSAIKYSCCQSTYAHLCINKHLILTDLENDIYGISFTKHC